ncbi:hypothetical protein AtubIFM55763_009864 [Aspergillus tubingensis]|uniref:Amine oxidase n=1 Tax=Aspergillus tubingensis TaxID=5068 RepID=A0A8H3Y2S0_ASPTU|nr:putative flavin-containing amine oxidase [Aspergillus tubingensis]GFN20675.1 putative flavin-containing amine oxidase [Aspergillus tubingensis]GLA63180.1 hypothetical protein AtubIFM54640_004320 [Aspergillus tubingensis]GLA77674.1 hypothetical protein AtubIFM55763_009864 [Aspergillus tubingensis]GLA82725.1 hypothetical protein AtubIFM56815_006915 [Aspergillus tubingensis]GLB22763.1 hypothetical protein AtubIFM61612_003342 [Aspergillus tubingensis]
MPKSDEGFIWTAKGGFQYGLTTEAVAPSTPPSGLSFRYDVIVVGAGFAGLTAARDLAFRGKSVLLVEARDRIGGRCWTAEVGDDTKVELGGTWVHWQQPHVFSELQRYDLANFQETVAFPENGEFVVKESRSHPARVQDSAEGQVMMERLEGLMEKFFDVDGQGGRSVIRFPFSTASSVEQNPDYLELDKLSLADRIAQLDGCSQEERSMLSAHTASFYGVSPEKVSFAEVLHTHALCNFDPAMMEIATMKYKIARGTTAFARAILDDYKGARIFGSPVTSITQTGGEFPDYPVIVTLKDGNQFVSKFVISTIPINVISSITFDPPLSTLQREAFATGVTPAKSDKLLVCTSSDLRNGFNVTCEGGDMPYTSGFTDGKHGNHTLLTLLAHPGNSLDRSEENIRLVETLRPTGIQVDSACGHLWSEDPYAGGVMPVRGPGFLQKYHDAVRRPHGQVYFCGSDLRMAGGGLSQVPSKTPIESLETYCDRTKVWGLVCTL